MNSVDVRKISTTLHFHLYSAHFYFQKTIFPAHSNPKRSKRWSVVSKQCCIENYSTALTASSNYNAFPILLSDCLFELVLPITFCHDSSAAELVSLKRCTFNHTWLNTSPAVQRCNFSCRVASLWSSMSSLTSMKKFCLMTFHILPYPWPSYRLLCDDSCRDLDLSLSHRGTVQGSVPSPTQWHKERDRFPIGACDLTQTQSAVPLLFQFFFSGCAVNMTSLCFRFVGRTSIIKPKPKSSDGSTSARLMHRERKRTSICHHGLVAVDSPPCLPRSIESPAPVHD